jgi:FLVCR family MFS transporter 7
MSSSRSNEEISSTLWKISSGKNGDKYLTFSGNATRVAVDDENQNLSNSNTQIRVYKMRWYILAVICFANIANAINWINFSSIADFTGEFYQVGYDAVNYLSLSYLIIAIPAGFFSFWLIDNFGVRTSINLGAWFNFLGSCIRVVSSIDSANGVALVSPPYKYTVLMIGQCFCALAQPFIMFVTTKFANTWFGENQRALANTLALGSNTVGILIGAFISPQIVNSSVTFVSQMCLLNLISCVVSIFPAIMACFITRSTPPSPPSYSAMINTRQTETNDTNEYLLNEDASERLIQTPTFKENFKIYLSHIAKLLKSKDFLILLFSFGLSLGLFNALTTLIEQIICVRGYSDDDAGYFGGAMIVSGIVGSILAGVILDKTKRFEELAKICFAMSSLSSIFFCILQLYDNDKSVIYYLILISFCLIGFFGLPLLPICMEMSIECVYPIPEATSTGLLFIGGQIFGIIMIILYPKVSTKLDPNSYTYISVQKCGTSDTFSNSTMSTTTASPDSLDVLDFKIPLFSQTILLNVISLFFIMFFKCAYLRLRSEREKLAEQILNSARQ